MSLVDAMFEAQSGFSTTGATVLTDVEDPALVPRSILFWRSSTHCLKTPTEMTSRPMRDYI